MGAEGAAEEAADDVPRSHCCSVWCSRSSRGPIKRFLSIFIQSICYWTIITVFAAPRHD